MNDPAFAALQDITAAAFVVVALLALREWMRDRDRIHGYLATTLLALGGVATLALIGPNLTGTAGTVVADAELVLFMVSGAALLWVRHQVVPLRRLARGAAAAALTVSGLGLIVATRGTVGTGAACSSTPSQLGPGAAALGVFAACTWSACVLEPGYRLWRLSHDLPAVQGARLRFLSAGYAAVVAVVVVEVSAVLTPCGTSGLVPTLLQLVALAIMPVLYISFVSPSWVRGIWRQREEEALRGAVQELLLFTPDRATLGDRALQWAIRLVGGEGGLVADAGKVVLATAGPSAGDAVSLLSGLPATFGPSVVALPGAGERRAIVQPLALATGQGALIVISGHLSPLFQTDEFDRLAGYASSITAALDRVRLFENARRKEAELSEARDIAQAASSAKSDFLSRMSHELRTPLTAMLGFAELMRLDEITPKHVEYVDTILRAGTHLLALVNDVLDIAAIEAGKLAMSPEFLNVRSVIAETIDLIRPLADGRRITVETRVDSELTVAADHQRLKQILLNLVSNAVKYNRDLGVVRISAIRFDRATVRISVTDTGGGLTDVQIAKLFSPFERLQADRAGVAGTGLGLTLSRTLAEAMHGRMGVESSLGEGSTFWVEMPWHEEAAAGAGGAAGQAPPTDHREYESERTILLVEDTLSNIRLVEGILERRPQVRLVTTEQGAFAVELAQQHRPDLVLLDLHLPDLDGSIVLEQLRAETDLATMPVVMLTADATPGQRERLLASGAQGYLTKPISIPLFLEMVDRFVGSPTAAAARGGGDSGHGASSPGSAAAGDAELYLDGVVVVGEEQGSPLSPS